MVFMRSLAVVPHPHIMLGYWWYYRRWAGLLAYQEQVGLKYP